MKAVFDTRPDTGYDDEIVRRYHFPNRYLPAAEQCVGDWIVYRETRRGSGRPGYVAVARVSRLEPDPSDSGSSYALVTDFLRFDVVVPLRHATGYFEARLRSVKDPRRIGVALQGHSVRTISDADFGAVVRAGLRETLDPVNLAELERGGADSSVRAFVGASPEEQERRIVQMLVNCKLLWRGRRFPLAAMFRPPTSTVPVQPVLRCATDPAVMDIDPTWPERVLRQEFACVFVRAPNPTVAVEFAAKRLGHMGGWKVGPGVDQEVFPWEEYREHARPGDYTRSVILGSRA